MTIVTHPANLEFLKAKVDSGEYDNPNTLWNYIKIRTNPHMERDKPTGRYWEDGCLVEKEEILVDEPFVQYGPEDVEYLLMSGKIEEEREPLFYVMNEELLIEPRRFVTINGV